MTDVAAQGREYLNGKALAQYFGVSRMTLHRWQHGYTDSTGTKHPPLDGFPKPYQFSPGSFPLYRLAEIEAFAASRRV